MGVIVHAYHGMATIAIRSQENMLAFHLIPRNSWWENRSLIVFFLVVIVIDIPLSSFSLLISIRILSGVASFLACNYNMDTITL
jgi:hypothetical protein